jgi:opacity protein-like surface antigen
MNRISKTFGIMILLFVTDAFSEPNSQFYAAVDAGIFQANFNSNYIDQTDIISQNISESVLQNGYTGGVALGYNQIFSSHYFFGGEISAHLNSDSANYQSGAATAAFSDTQKWHNYYDFTLLSGIITKSSFSPYLKLGLSYAIVPDNLNSPVGYTPTPVNYHTNKNVLGFTAGLGIKHLLTKKVFLFSELNFHDYGTIHFNDFQNFTADYTHSTHLCSYSLSVGAAYSFNA